ncbi:MAG: hypothetical protein R2720_04480 [Candidatus Nanopelagicales bacterium]
MSAHTPTPSITRLAVPLITVALAATLAPTPATAAAPTQTTATASAAAKLRKAPKLRYRTKKHTLVVKARPGTLKIVTRTADGHKTRQRVVTLRRKTRIAVPDGAVRVRARQVRPVVSRWARLRLPGSNNRGTGNTGDTGDTTTPGTGTIPSTPGTAQHQAALAVINRARTQGGYCSDGRYCPPLAALRENRILTEMAVYSVQGWADPWSKPTAPEPTPSTWTALFKSPATRSTARCRCPRMSAQHSRNCC